MRCTLWVVVWALWALSCRSGGEDGARARSDEPGDPTAEHRTQPGDPPTDHDRPEPPGPSADASSNPAPHSPNRTTSDHASGPHGGRASDPNHTGQSPHAGHGHVPFTPCPVPDERAKDASALLTQATLSHQKGEFAIAFDCAAAAADIAPRSIDAHHIRAASAAALGRMQVAQMAFSLALALDPDDPTTLSAAADFYINAMPRHSREPIQVGLEYARRGRAQAIVRRGVRKELRAQLTLLEAQALNDIGKPDEALSRVDEALRLAPDWLEAYHERGVALFNLCRFNGAKDAFAQVIMGEPGDAFAHHHLGLIHEHLGRAARSEHHFRKARALSPTDFWPPVDISSEEFQREVTRAVAELSQDTQAMLAQVSVEVADLPSVDDLTAVEPPFSPTILGLFRGLPLTVESDDYGPGIPPRAIVLYRKNLARTVRSRTDLDAQIRRTLTHEIGHLTGLDEDELRRRGLE